MADRKLWTTRAICDETAARYRLRNVAEIAAKYGVSYTTAKAWQRGAVMDEAQVKTAALLLDEDAGWLQACLALERVKDDTLSQQFRRVLLACATPAAAAVAGFFVLAPVLLAVPLAR